jgi:hypothetical protein
VLVDLAPHLVLLGAMAQILLLVQLLLQVVGKVEARHHLVYLCQVQMVEAVVEGSGVIQQLLMDSLAEQVIHQVLHLHKVVMVEHQQTV